MVIKVKNVIDMRTGDRGDALLLGCAYSGEIRLIIQFLDYNALNIDFSEYYNRQEKDPFNFGPPQKEIIDRRNVLEVENNHIWMKHRIANPPLQEAKKGWGSESWATLGLMLGESFENDKSEKFKLNYELIGKEDSKHGVWGMAMAVRLAAQNLYKGDTDNLSLENHSPTLVLNYYVPA